MARWGVAVLAACVMLAGGVGGQAVLGQTAQVDSEFSPAATPVLLPVTGIAAVAPGGFHTCALTTGGGARCWGDNSFGQLGNGNSGLGDVSMTPGGVAGLGHGVKQVVTGLYHSCALKRDGAVVCWGLNMDGQLGDGNRFNSSSVPVAVLDLPESVEVVAGFHHTCALTQAGAVKCWGDNRSGQLGDTNQGLSSDTPVNVFGLTSGVEAITAGGDHSCALKAGGGVVCWGDNSRGQLGDGQRGQNSDFPVPAVGLESGAQAVDAGAYHTCALNELGEAECWGADEQGQLGNGAPAADEDTPQAVVGLAAGVRAISAGGDYAESFTCARDQGGVRCWGANTYGQLGNGTAGAGASSDVPVDVQQFGGGVQVVSAGGFHACAVTADGGARCWGDNRFGQLGNATRTSRSEPVAVRQPVWCYQLALGYSGGGVAPVAAPTHSAICPDEHYVVGEPIALAAQSDPGWRVAAWQGTDNDSSTEPANTLLMPTADHSVTVLYTLEQSAAVYLPAIF